MAGYPAKVMREFRRLKAQQARELTRLEEQKRAASGPG
jgi:soluble lytic murein transglycosylase